MKKKFVSCFDIGEVPRSPGKWNWNWLYFLPFIFTFEQGEYGIHYLNFLNTILPVNLPNNEPKLFKFDANNIKEFAEFCKDSGGFRIG